MNIKTINARLRILRNAPFADRPEVKADIKELERLRREAMKAPQDEELPFTEDNEPEIDDERMD
jgi:hypothetical protein